MDSLKEIQELTQKLDHYERRCESIIEGCTDAVVTIDEQDYILSFNPAAVKLFGYNEAEIIGQEVTVLMPNKYHEPHQHALQKYIHTGQATIIGKIREVQAKRKDNSLFTAHICVTEIKSENGREFLATIRDMADLIKD